MNLMAGLPWRLARAARAAASVHLMQLRRASSRRAASPREEGANNGRSATRAGVSVVSRAISRKLAAAQRVPEVLDFVDEFGFVFDSANEAAALWSIARLNAREASRGAHGAWADARALEDDFRLRSLLSCLEARLLADRSSGRDVSHIAGAMAKLGFGANPISSRVWGLLARRAQQRSADLSLRALARTAWAFATAKVGAPELFCALAHAAERRIDPFDAHAFAMIAWAFATARAPAPELFGAIGRAAEPCVGEVGARDLAISAWAFATARMHAPALFCAIARSAERRVDEFNAQGISNLAWAFATSRVAAPALFCKLARAAEERAGEFGTQELANVVWALSLPEDACAHARTVLLLAERALDGRTPEPAGAARRALSREEAHAIANALLIASHCRAETELGARIATQLERARALAPLQATVVSSSAHARLSAALLGAGWAHACEVQLEGGLIVLDMACVRTRVAVEFDGPTHFLRDVASGDDVIDGSTISKSRVLAALGWRVHRVGYRQWAALSSSDETRRFCDELVRTELQSSQGVVG